MSATRFLLCSVFALAAACGVQGSPFLDGDRPIAIGGVPVTWPGAAHAALAAAAQWNPQARGAAQLVHVEISDFDRCRREPQLAAFAPLVPPTVAVCARFSPASEAEVLQLLAHEVGHLLGGEHLAERGNVMSDPLASPPVWQYTAADERSICQYGRGGRCATPRW